VSKQRKYCSTYLIDCTRLNTVKRHRWSRGRALSVGKCLGKWWNGSLASWVDSENRQKNQTM